MKMTVSHAFIAAPLLVLAYGGIRIVDGLDGVRGPGPAWTVGHLAFLFALGLFVPLVAELRRMAGRIPAAVDATRPSFPSRNARSGAGRFAAVAAVVAYAGISAFTVQFGIDLAAGFLAADKAEMSRMLSRVMDIPAVTPVFYVVGPSLFYVGLVALTARLAVLRRVGAWVPVLVFVGSILPVVDKDLLPIGAVCLLVALLPPARIAATGASPRERTAA